MVIQRSSSAQTARLIDDLIGTDPVRREAAVARLAIVGERAVERLLAALAAAEASPEATIDILRTLELIGSPRVVGPALARLGAPSDAVAIAAVGALRAHLRAADADIARQTLEGLTTLALSKGALSKGRSDPPRLAALEALGELGTGGRTDEETLQLIRDRLKLDRSMRVRRMAGWTEAQPPANAAAQLEAAARGTLPDDPEAVRALIAEAGRTVALSVMHDLVLTLRTKERGIAAHETARLDWIAARAAAHQALAERGSRLAVFDLRDTFEEASARLPLGFIAALERVGDASCLPGLAAAWQQVDDGWMRDHLATAFQTIMTREGLTRRHAAVRRALERAPAAADALVKPAKARTAAR